MPLERLSAADNYLEVLERVLDKGIVIDASVRVSLAGLELLRIHAWVVVASCETYLRHRDLMKRITTGCDVTSDPLAEPEPER